MKTVTVKYSSITGMFHIIQSNLDPLFVNSPVFSVVERITKTVTCLFTNNAENNGFILDFIQSCLMLKGEVDQLLNQNGSEKSSFCN